MKKGRLETKRQEPKGPKEPEEPEGLVVDQQKVLSILVPQQQTTLKRLLPEALGHVLIFLDAWEVARFRHAMGHLRESELKRIYQAQNVVSFVSEQDGKLLRNRDVLSAWVSRFSPGLRVLRIRGRLHMPHDLNTWKRMVQSPSLRVIEFPTPAFGHFLTMDE